MPERGRSRHARRSPLVNALIEFAIEVGLVLGAVLLYFGVRGLTEGNHLVAARHGLDVLRFEARLGLDLEASVQDFVLARNWLTTLANWIYIWAHWPVITVALVWLHHAHRRGYLRLRNAMFLSGAIGLVIFALYPVAPPRLLDVGLLDTVTERSNAYRVLQPPALVNKYAAVPSLHVGWNLLVGVALWQNSRNRVVRTFAVLSPMAMAFAVVATANHYVIDGVLGAALSLAAYQVVRHLPSGNGRHGRHLAALAAVGLAQPDEQVGVVEDQAGHAPGQQLVCSELAGDAPGDDLPAAGS